MAIIWVVRQSKSRAVHPGLAPKGDSSTPFDLIGSELRRPGAVMLVTEFVSSFPKLAKALNHGSYNETFHRNI